MYDYIPNVYLLTFLNLSKKKFFLYRRKNGKVKKYNEKGILIYDVEYINGKITGNSKEYDENREIKCENYQYENLNGIISEKIKEYNENGEIIFEGEYINNRLVNGKGKNN